jgi:hypothetical protein
MLAEEKWRRSASLLPLEFHIELCQYIYEIAAPGNLLGNNSVAA